MGHTKGVRPIVVRAKIDSKLLGALAFALVASVADAGPIAHVSRTHIAFGRTPQSIPSAVQPFFVTNTGDAPLVVSSLAIVGVSASTFAVSGTCGPPLTLQSGERCRVDATMTAVGKFPTLRSATVQVATSATADPIAVTLSGIVDNGNPQSPFQSVPVDATPDWLDFAPQVPHATGPAGVMTVTNTGNLNFTLGAMALAGGDAADFSMTRSCNLGAPVPPGQSCAATITFVPLAEGPRSTELEVMMIYAGVEGIYRYSITGIGAGAAAPQVIPVVEYFNAGFGHYFMTAQSDEIAGLDAGAFNHAFVRTALGFNAWSAPAAGTVPVCRFFTVTFAPKSSHFYTADPVECEGVKQNPNWQYEKIAFHIVVPVAGTCEAGSVPVYRMYNNGQTGAPNHRFTTDLALYQQFTSALNWSAEGIAFCAPA